MRERMEELREDVLVSKAEFVKRGDRRAVSVLSLVSFVLAWALEQDVF